MPVDPSVFNECPLLSVPQAPSLFLFFFLHLSFLFMYLLLFIYLFIYGCVGSSFLREGFL